MSLPSNPVLSANISRAVIPAAGLGTRLRPLSNAYPKEMLPVGRKPVLAHIAEELLMAGVTEALFIISDKKRQIEAFFGEEYSPLPDYPSLRCSYVLQEVQRGLGDALLYAEDWVGEAPFLVAFGDCLIDSEPSSAPIRRLVETHLAKQASATVLVEQIPLEKVSRYGVLEPRDTLPMPITHPFAAKDLVEKPKPEAAPSNLVVAARWVLSPEIFAELREVAPDPKGEITLTDAVRSLCRKGQQFWAVPMLAGEARRDIGNFETFFGAFVRYALRDQELGEIIQKVMEEEKNRKI